MVDPTHYLKSLWEFACFLPLLLLPGLPDAASFLAPCPPRQPFYLLRLCPVQTPPRELSSGCSPRGLLSGWSSSIYITQASVTLCLSHWKALWSGTGSSVLSIFRGGQFAVMQSPRRCYPGLGTSLSGAEPAALDHDPGGWGSGSHVVFSPRGTAGL